MIDSEKSQPKSWMRESSVHLRQSFQLKELHLSGFAGTYSVQRNPSQETIQGNYFNSYFLVSNV